MKPWMRVAAGVGVVVVAGCAGLYGYGSTLPETHTATVEVHVDGSPAEVEARVRDWRAAASWKRDVQSVGALPEVAGRARFRECTWECCSGSSWAPLDPKVPVVSRLRARMSR